MIRATITATGGIRILASPDSALFAASLPGATRNAKMPIRQWNMPFTQESIGVLRDAEAQFTPELEAEAARTERVHAFVERQKTAEKVAPIAEIPLAPGCQMFEHQVKAYNITLALLGYELPVERG